LFQPKTDEQLDLQALHRVRSRLVSERTAVINQIRGFLLERGIIVRQGLRFLRQALPDILAKRTDVLSPRMVRIVADLASDWRQLDERIEVVTDEIETLAKSDSSCRRVMTVPGIGPIISSAMIAAIGSGAAFARGRDFSAWIGLVPSRCRPETEPSSGASAHALHASSPGHSATAGKLAEARLRGLARSRRSAPPSQRFGRSSRQQAGTDRLDGAGARTQL
jgi:transposase